MDSVHWCDEQRSRTGQCARCEAAFAAALELFVVPVLGVLRRDIACLGSELLFQRADHGLLAIGRIAVVTGLVSAGELPQVGQ
jgi:hypothetical protein